MALLSYLFFWFAPPRDLQDPWNEAFSLLTSAHTIQDISARQRLMDGAGYQLKELARMHPYHARVHYLLGAYYNDVGDYASAIAQAKEALRLGSGAIVRRVDGVARQLLVAAVVNKARPYIAMKDYGAAHAVIREAYDAQTAAITSPTLADVFHQTLQLEPKRGEFFYVLGTIAVSQHQIASAIVYLEKSLADNPGLIAAQKLRSELMQSSPSSIPRAIN
jgi:tetratricopeptide (TPR) repeat protein